MRSSLVLAALFLALLLAAGVNVLARGERGLTAAQEASPDCAVTLHRKYDYSGRLYIQKVRICRKTSDA